MEAVKIKKILNLHSRYFKTYGKKGELADFSNLDLSSADFSNLDLRYANFSNSNLESANFSDAEL